MTKKKPQIYGMQPFHYAAFAEPFGFNSEQDNKVIRFGMYVCWKGFTGILSVMFAVQIKTYSAAWKIK